MIERLKGIPDSEIFDAFEIYKLMSANNVDVHWGNKYLGFGGLYFYVNDEKIMLDSEMMSRDAVRAILHKLADYIADNAEIEVYNNDNQD